MENWCSSLSLKELLKLLKIKNLSINNKLERNEIEEVIINNISNINEANNLLKLYLTNDIINKLNHILLQNRHIINFIFYETSEEHKRRLEERPIRMNIIRNEWFNHPNYRKRSQMPSYHVHFREEMQLVLNNLYECYQNNENEEYEIKNFLKAYSIFQNSMEGLHFHVQIEERSFFPDLQRKNPDFDLSFLYKDHEHLHEAEDNLKNKFQLIERKIKSSKGKKRNNNDDNDNDNNNNDKILSIEDKSEILLLALKFDEVLINHLGEEEEIVVPLCL